MSRHGLRHRILAVAPQRLRPTQITVGRREVADERAQRHALGRKMRAALISLLVLILAAAAFVALNWSGGELAARLRLPPGGTARLGWDLAWTVAAAALALWIVARWAPVAARWQAGAAWTALTALTLWALAALGDGFPLWFDAGLLAALPVLGVCAWRWAGASPRRRPGRA